MNILRVPKIPHLCPPFLASLRSFIEEKAVGCTFGANVLRSYLCNEGEIERTPEGRFLKSMLSAVRFHVMTSGFWSAFILDVQKLNWSDGGILRSIASLIVPLSSSVECGRSADCTCDRLWLQLCAGATMVARYFVRKRSLLELEEEESKYAEAAALATRLLLLPCCTSTRSQILPRAALHIGVLYQPGGIAMGHFFCY